MTAAVNVLSLRPALTPGRFARYDGGHRKGRRALSSMASTTHTHTRNGAVWRQLLPTHRLSVVAKTPVLVALGLFLAGGRFVWGTVGWTLVLAAALWGVLYALNEAYDLAYEDGYEVGPSV